MISNNSKDKLLKENLIKKCPIDHKAIENLLKRARIDLKTAKRNLEQDEECAYNYAYNALLRSGIKEAKDAIKTAEEFVDRISNIITLLYSHQHFTLFPCSFPPSIFY